VNFSYPRRLVVSVTDFEIFFIQLIGFDILDEKIVAYTDMKHQSDSKRFTWFICVYVSCHLYVNKAAADICNFLPPVFSVMLVNSIT
jgi:hypothetical protein